MILCLAISNIVSIREVQRLKSEINAYHIELGDLTIEDPDCIHYAVVPNTEPRVWKWRIFVPKGDHAIVLDTNVVRRGTPAERSMHGGSELVVGPCEFTYTLRAVNENEFGWTLFTSKTTGSGSGSHLHLKHLPASLEDFLSHGGSHQLGKMTTRTTKVDNGSSAELLKLTLGEDYTSPIRKGIHVWVERIPANTE